VDAWTIEHPASTAAVLGRFLTWARERGLCGPLRPPTRPRADTPRTVPDDQRWQHLRRCLTDTSMPLAARTAGAITLLYGAHLTRVLTLPPTAFTTDGRRAHLLLGRHPVPVPPALAELIGEQIASPGRTRTLAPVPAGARRWLFPGAVPYRPLGASHLAHRLRGHGIAVQAGRSAALITLAETLPGPVLADMLGLHPATAVHWSRVAAHDWASYLAARTSQTADDY
jgi:hypothetical protein